MSNTNIETISVGETILAIIISHRFNDPGVQFFTPDDFSQQVAYMRHQSGKIIAPHTHNLVSRQIHFTQEVLFVRRGKIRVDCYDESKKYIESRVLEEGDVILLAAGGHGFEALEEVEIVEVKQGPFAGDADKVRFDPVDSSDIIIR
ncbi:MAG: hypothetical protein OEM02_13015 [Desulfobulbaceae bacterium]|nr:hypothetical protein [Desulfobulbaceae bacterium]